MTADAPDLLAALTAALAAPEPDMQWMTTREIQARTGLPQAKALATLRLLAEAGRLEMQWAVRVNLAGCAQKVPVYRLRQGESLGE